MARDWKDTFVIVHYLMDRNPFECGENLNNIANGMHAQATVNADKALEIGSRILNQMDGISPADYTFKRKDQAITMASKNAVKVDGESIEVDPQLLFQRLSTAAGSDLEASLAYELCTYPPALFESPNLLLEPQKATLADAIWNFAKPDQCTVPARALTVLDGGALLHRLPWKRGSSFFEILCKYTEYVKNRYPNVTVVFDGYETASTKDMTHRRRNKGKQGVTAAFTKDMKLAVSKEVFLSNKKNKQKFIHMLGNELQMNGCSIFHEKADADYSIVQKTIQYTDTQAAVLVGDDTDLLILLLYHAGNLGHKVYFAPEPKKNSKSRVWDISEIQMKLGPYLCNQMLYIHAMLGCETTSRFHGIGKGALLKKIRSSETLQQSAKVFDSPRSTEIDIERAREIAIV